MRWHVSVRPSAVFCTTTGQRERLEPHPFRQRLLDLVDVGRHFLTRPPIQHRDLLGTEPQGRAGGVDRRVAAAHDRNAPAHRRPLSERDTAEERDAIDYAADLVPFHLQAPGGMRAKSEEDGVEALPLQLPDRGDPSAGPDFNPGLPDDVQVVLEGALGETIPRECPVRSMPPMTGSASNSSTLCPFTRER